MSPRVKYGPHLKKHIGRYNLHKKMKSVLALLGDDAQQVVDWAQGEAKIRRREMEKKHERLPTLGKMVYDLVGYEAALRLVRRNHERGRLTSKSEVKKRTGQSPQMPLLYRNAGLRHPQEARNLRHNLFHEAFLKLVDTVFENVETSVPSTGQGLTPDLLIRSSNPGWEISVEYKGYRSFTLLSESEVLKAMRYQRAFGTAWLVTSSIKNVRPIYGGMLDSEELIEEGIKRLRRISKRRAYTKEQKESRAIAKKGIRHLRKMKGENLKCKLVPAQEVVESCKNGSPIKGLSITSGCEFIDMLRENDLNREADDVLKVMKSPTQLLHSDKVTSVKLIE
ncbi:hypothetical protein EU537_08380 [Candidatus Thorarchaeota archaeon]|nr:MAG: hypothetical protein EU537_08380 [Candidatus Thorarchaeota archaeon]